MKKILSLALSALMILGIIAYAGVALAQNSEGDFRPAAVLDGEEFLHMTPQEQYEYLKTLGSEEEIEQTLSLLSAEQLAALEEYRLSVEGQSPEPLESDAPDGSQPASDEDAPDSDDTGSSGINYSAMTPQELYEYLITLESDEEIDAVLSTLTPEQNAAFVNYVISVMEKEESENEGTPAVNYTNAAPFLDPVDVLIPMMARQFAAQALDCPEEEEDALVLDKTVSGSDGSYMLNIEAYATGEVSITTGETPIPADIILVLDTSGSMAWDMDLGTYTAVSFSTNEQAYSNRDDLYVKVDDQYYSVTIEREWTSGVFNPKYRYTYRYTIDGTPYTHTSDNNGSGDAPPSWAFYKPDTTSRLAALKIAANNFIDSIETKANAVAGGVDHRIAVVTFESDASIRSGNHASTGAFVSTYNNTTGINSLQSTINGLSADGATRADLGMELAVDIFDDDLPDTAGLRNRVVVFFTDGTPTSHSEFDPEVANDAIDYAKTLKTSTSASPAGYGATVYTIGIFDGANPTMAISSASNENKFMHFVSSNYPNATSMTSYGTGSNAGYYLSASSTTALNSIFQSISENIETGGTTVTLDETSVVKDVIAPYFQLPPGAVTSDIHLYTSEVDENTGVWLSRVPFSGTVTISADRKTIGVSGFDYADNYYAAIETNGVITGYQGKKLIIEIPIEYIPGSCFGGTVPTNKPVSGVYDDDFLVEALPIPKVDIPVQYDFTPLDQPIYLTQDAEINGLFTTAAGFVADGVNNAYVNIVYTVKSPGGTALGTYTISAGQATGTWDISTFELEGLTANTAYTVSCTVTPVSIPIDLAKVYPITVSKTATVYVWKPEVTWRDSVIYLGETANYNSNFVSAIWKNVTASAPSPAGIAPALSYEFTPAAAKFTAETHVSVVVKIGSTNVTAHTYFVHQACGFTGCGYNPAFGQFMVHIKTCSLTITKTGAADPTDTFIFTVTGGGLTLHVSVQGNGSTTIVGLPVGEYTIVEEGAWSWRYTADEAHITLNASNASDSATVINDETDDRWLSGDSYAANTFPDES